MLKNNLRLQFGMTLVEMLVSVALIIIVMGGAAGFVIGLYRAYYYTFEQSQAVNEALIGVETMTKEIREAVSGNDGSYIIEKADDFEFIFYSDIDGDSLVERVRYFLDGSNFTKEVIRPVGMPLHYITNPSDPSYLKSTTFLSTHVRNLPPIFRYFDGNLQELPSPARLKDTKIMRVNLVVNIQPDRLPGDFVLESEVQLRNLKTNL